MDRFGRRKRLPQVVLDRMAVIEQSYFGTQRPEETPLADPLLVLERGPAFERPWPATFATVGTADLILDDTRRLGAALAKLGAPCDVRYYPREPHAFHAFVWRAAAQQCWRDSYAFLDRTLA
jgi:acetyl esterase